MNNPRSTSDSKYLTQGSGQISDAQYTDLAQMIDQAIAEEAAAAADLLDEALKTLRAHSHKADLGL